MRRYAVLFLVVFLAAGCNSEHEAGDSKPVGSGSLIADPALQAQALTIIHNACGSCHANGVALGGVANIDDVGYLISAGLIVPGDSTKGRLVGSIEDASMPTAGPMPPADLQAIRNWIASFRG